MIRTDVWMKLLASVLFTAVTAFAQSLDRLPVTDAEKIADALRAQGKDELAEAIEGSSSQIVGPVRSEVFIAQDGVVHRMKVQSTATSGGKTVTTEMQMDFSDFGIKPNIVIPDDSRVYDITPQLEEGLDSFGQES